MSKSLPANRSTDTRRLALDRVAIASVLLLLATWVASSEAIPPQGIGSCGHNSAALFEGVWAFRDGSGPHVAWITRGERFSQRFDVYCLRSSGEIVARIEVPSNNRPSLGCYEIDVPPADTYIVSEVDSRWGGVSESRVAVYSEGKPARVTETQTYLLSNAPAIFLSQVEVPTIGPTRFWATPGVESGGGVDFVIYGDGSILYDEAFDMLFRLRDLGYEIAAWEGTSMWQDAQSVGLDAFEHNAEVEHPRLPTLVILGSAHESAVLREVGTVYYADETGECPLGTCASDAKIVDFDGDDVPDIPWTRVLGRSATDMRHATDAAIRQIDCGAFGPQRAVILDGDLTAFCVQVPEPRVTLERIHEQLMGANVPTTILHESDSPCGDWSHKRSRAIYEFGQGLTELVGIGYLTSRRHLPGNFVQDVHEPYFTVSSIPFPELFVAEMFACGSGDEDGVNLGDDPWLVEQFMTSDPDQNPVAVAWLGNRRGGFLRNHMMLAERYFANKLASDGTSSLQEVLFNTIRELALENPGLKNHLLLTTAFGWPTWPASRCVPPAVVSARSSSQTHPLLVAACPQGDADTLIVSVDFDEDATPRDFLASEVTLDVSDFASTVFDADGILAAGYDAIAPLHKTSVRHSHFGGCSSEPLDVLLNGFPAGVPATSTIRSTDLSGDGAVNLSDFAAFGSPHFPRSGVAGDCSDFDADNDVDLTDFAAFSAHHQHNSPYGAVNSATPALSSNATVVLHFTEEYPTATTHLLYVDVDVDGFADVSASIFALAAGNDRLSLNEWSPAEATEATVLFAPVNRDGTEELYFGMLEVESHTGLARLGRLTYDVLGTEPLVFDENDFHLAAGEVLVEETGGADVIAQMTGVLGRTLAQDITRIYHNRLEQNFPNPFNPTTTLAFSIKHAGTVSLTIYDVAGRRVRELVNERRERGAYKVVWAGQNDRGQTVASGVYFYKLVAGSFTDTRKMTVLR